MKGSSRIGIGVTIAGSVLWALSAVPALAQTGSATGSASAGAGAPEIPDSGAASGAVSGSGAAEQLEGKNAADLKTGTDSQALTGTAEEQKDKASEKLPPTSGQLPSGGSAGAGASASGSGAGADAEAESGM
jgi:hypothetical protein